jgi:hypothetical protein
LLKRVLISWKFPGFSPKIKVGKFLMFPYVSVC